MSADTGKPYSSNHRWLLSRERKRLQRTIVVARPQPGPRSRARPRTMAPLMAPPQRPPDRANGWRPQGNGITSREETPG